MNQIVEEMLAILDEDENTLKHYGVGHDRGGHSGRYPYGSGEDPYQHGSLGFLERVDEMRKNNFVYTDENGVKYSGDVGIAKSMGYTTTQLRTEYTIAKNEQRAAKVARAKELKEEGYNTSEIGRKLGVNESSVRSYLNSSSESRMNKGQETAEFLKQRVKETGGMVDVGTGAERELRISKEKMNEALYLLEREGYHVYSGGIPQATNQGQQTTQKVLCAPGIENKEIYNYDKVGTVKEYISRDGGQTFEKKFNYPASMDASRLMVRYAEEGGVEKDGLVEIRRGLDDLSLGESRYSQVRILVNGTHYVKGMAVYSDDLPDGVDVMFNTNKPKGTEVFGTKDKSVLKPIKKDPDNPFGSAIKDADQGGQYWYVDKKTGEKKLGLINKRADEGDWEDWKNALPSQFLAKQSMPMIEKQLGLAKADKLAEYDEISSLTNPTVKKYLLGKFADECDSAAVSLQAAALPGQRYHALIPIPTMKDTEVYAPNYENGTKVALIRYPHGGTFEIPILTVNNKQPEARKMLGTDIIDAVGINKKVADQLSGADFDGDTVMVIPTHDRAGKVKITATHPLKDLEGFDNKALYQYDTKTVDADGSEHYFRDGREFKIMKNTGTQMGVISNLITDMTLAGADETELARAVKHSMVVVDAEKHKLDYKQSEIDNGVEALRRKYQQKIMPDGSIKYGGASTILSRSKGEKQIDKRQGNPTINMPGSKNYDPSKPEGSLIYKTADDLYYPKRSYDKKTRTMTMTTEDGKRFKYSMDDREAVAKYNPIKKTDEKTGEVYFTNSDGTIRYKTKKRTEYTTNMGDTDDAMTLVSTNRHPKEIAYAEYANSMKALANRARKEQMTTGKIEYSRAAKEKYSAEVKSLNDKLNVALLNATRERAAQRIANHEVSVKKSADPDMSKGDIKKANQRAITQARQTVGSMSRRERNISITPREWEAIQAGAVSESTLIKILNNTDTAHLRQLATPRATTTLSQAKINRIKAMSASNYTLNEISKLMGISTSTISSYLKGGN